jgi:hypothetical protein
MLPRPGEDGTPQSISERAFNAILIFAIGFAVSAFLFTTEPQAPVHTINSNVVAGAHR